MDDHLARTILDGLPAHSPWEPVPGHCLLCGGSGGWYAGEHPPEFDWVRCARCDSTGWDPQRDEPWFRELVAPKQTPT
jgi:hypothetical protein